MLQRLLTVLALLVLAQAVQAAEAGKLIFVTGAADVAGKPAVLNAAVQEGDQLATGADGFIYIRTVDNGLFILRPNTKARIAAYHVDTVNPANTRVKLELISGTARSRSGEAVKKARQNFRFNTPVAAIGVRGTDFTVTTDQNVSRVYVISGAIVMTGFDGACRADGTGPCEGQASRELSASQRGLLLQLQRGQAAPQLISAGALGPDQVAPPRADEPVAKGGADASIDAQKSASLEKAAAQLPPSTPPSPPPVVTPPPVVVDNPPPVVVTPPPPPPPALPERPILWGRWQAIMDQAPNVDFVGEKAKGAELVALKGNFVLFRETGDQYSSYVAPKDGAVGFALASSEAYVYNSDPKIGVSVAQIDNAKLNVDFGKSSFATSFNLTTGSEVFKMRADGQVGSDGRLYGNGQFSYPTNMQVDGVLSNRNGGSAAYLFQGRLDEARLANGALGWTKQ
ncbi:MAG: FecR family protein [Telluria sp.]